MNFMFSFQIVSSNHLIFILYCLQINHPSALGIEEGHEIQVKYFGRDPVSGIMRLSRKVLQGPSSSPARSIGGKNAQQE